jgi:polyisoprenoid-binding protein YceI
MKFSYKHAMKSFGVLRTFSIGVLLFTCAIFSYAQDNEPCSSFRDGIVTEERLQTMLSAAEHGHLYRILPSTSRVGFCVLSKLTRINGEFREFQGGLSLWPDPGDEEQAMIAIEVNSLKTGSSIIENILKGDSFFDVEKYPEILFISTGIEWTSSTTAVLKGSLTLHGVTRSVEFQAKLIKLEEEANGQIDRFLAKASTTINRSEFGIGMKSPLINDDVDLCMTVEAIRYSN